MKIRSAVAGDADPITELWNPIIREELSTFNHQEKTPEEVAHMISDRRHRGYCFAVAMEGSTLLGFATYSQFRGGVGYQHTMEHTVVLAPEARGRGAGRALMQRLESHAASSGVHSMIAGVSGANAPGIAFHEAMGYKTVAVVPEVGRKFDQWLDLHLMQKIL